LAVKVKDVRHGYRFEYRSSHDLVHGIAVAGEFTLIPITKPAGLGILSNQARHSTRVDDHALDCARGSDGSDARLVRKRAQQFWELVAEEILSAPSKVETSQSRAQSNRLGAKRSVEIDEAVHSLNTI
jgi:hypothetical protein